MTVVRWSVGVVAVLAELLLVAFLVYDSSSRSWGYVAVDVAFMVAWAAGWALWTHRRRAGRR